MKKLLFFCAFLFFSLNTPIYAQYVPTPNIGLEIPANGSINWNIPLNYNFNKIDQLLSGQLAIPSLHIANNLIVDGSVTANSFIGAGGAGLATASTASQWSPVYYSASPTGNSFAGVTPFSGLAKYSATGPPSVATVTDINTLLLTGSNCGTTGYVYSPKIAGCIQTGANPAGVNEDVQFNLAGSNFGADSGFFTYNLSNHTLNTTEFISKVTNSSLNSDTFLTSPGSNDGIANALASSYCAPGPCTTIRPITSTDVSNVPIPPNGDTVIDYSRGGFSISSHNPLTSLVNPPGSVYNCLSLSLINCTTGYFDTSDPTALTLPTKRVMVSEIAGGFNSWSWNYGNSPNAGSNQWGPAGMGLQITNSFNTEGITEALSSFSVKHATGDDAPYMYNYSDGGSPDYSSEGTGNLFFGGGENPDYGHFTVGSGGSTGTTSLPIVYDTTISTNNRNATSSGAYMIDISKAVTSGHITGVGTEVTNFPYVTLLPTDLTVTPSTAYGDTSCEMPVPVVGNPSLTGSITCTITNIGGTSGSGFHTGLAELSGDFPEQVIITANGTISGTSQSVTFTYQHPHGSAQTMLWQGSSVIGTFLNYDQLSGINGFKSVFHVFGAPDSSHIYAEHNRGGVAINPWVTSGNLTFLTQTGSAVQSVATAGVGPFYNQMPNAVIAGCSDSNMNGAVTNVTYDARSSSLSWTSPRSGTSCSTATISLPNTYWAFTLYPGAAQLGPAISAPNNLPLEPNNVAWASGDKIEIPHHFMWHSSDIKTNTNIYSPLGRFASEQGTQFSYGGLGVGGNFRPFTISINNPCSYYIGCGGTMNLSAAITVGAGGNPTNGGLNGGGLRLGEAPLGGAPVISVGCPDTVLGGCSNTDPVQFLGGSQSNSESFYYYPDILSWGSPSFTVGVPSQRGQGKMSGGSYWVNGYLAGAGLTFSDDGTTARNHLTLCQYDNSYSVTVGNCNRLAAGSVIPDGALLGKTITGQASLIGGTVTAGLATPGQAPTFVYTGTAGSKQRQYSFTAVSPLGIEGTYGIHSGTALTVDPLDGSNYVTITCPTVIQGNYPAGTTYRVYDSLNNRPLGTCPLGGTVVDNSAGSVVLPPSRNANGINAAGQYQIESGGSIAFWNNPLPSSVIDTYLTRSASGALKLGTTNGGSDGSFTTGTFNGSGAGLTGIPDSSLSSNIAKLNVANTFTAAQTFDAVTANSITSSSIKVVGQDVCQKNGTNCPNFFVNYGRATLVGGTVTVSTSSSSSAYVYDLTNCGVSGTQGMLSIGTITPNVSFVINSSSATDTSVVCWAIH